MCKQPNTLFPAASRSAPIAFLLSMPLPTHACCCPACPACLTCKPEPPPRAASAHDPANHGCRLERNCQLGGAKRRVDTAQQRQARAQCPCGVGVGLALSSPVGRSAGGRGVVNTGSVNSLLCVAAAGRTSARGTAACSWRSMSRQVRATRAAASSLLASTGWHQLWHTGHQLCPATMATIDCCTECPVPAAVAAPPLQPTTTAQCTTCCWRAWSLPCCWSSWSP